MLKIAHPRKKRVIQTRGKRQDTKKTKTFHQRVWSQITFKGRDEHPQSFSVGLKGPEMERKTWKHCQGEVISKTNQSQGG